MACPHEEHRHQIVRRDRTPSLPRTVRSARVLHGRTAAWALAAALVGAACGSSSTPVDPAPSVTPLATPTLVDIAPELLTPLYGLGPCPQVTDPEIDLAGFDELGSLPLPAEAFLLEAKEQGGLLTVQGYVPLTPILFQLGFRENQDLEMISIENEIQESETLFTDGGRRVFLKAAAVCELGSRFIASIVAEADATAVPSPSGG